MYLPARNCWYSRFHSPKVLPLAVFTFVYIRAPFVCTAQIKIFIEAYTLYYIILYYIIIYYIIYICIYIIILYIYYIIVMLVSDFYCEY